VSETETPIAAPPAQSAYQRCDQCSSPVDDAQRYCVVCGARNKRAEDPVGRYLAVATSRSRAARASRPVSRSTRRAAGLGTALVIAVIPVALALGVIVGRANSGGDAKLIAALRAQKTTVVTTVAAGGAIPGAGAGAGAGATTAGVTASSVASTFSLTTGYAVELSTLPALGTDQAAVTRAEQLAKVTGATAVGVIDARDFSLSPNPPGEVYVVYSGQYKTKAEAVAALAKLRRHFPAALVIAVRAQASSTPSSKAGGQAKTTASKAQLAQGSNEVKQISHATGKKYLQAQNALPGSVSVP
jgi:SPOR domain